MLSKTLGIQIDNNKVHRLCTQLGDESSKWLEADRTNDEIKPKVSEKGEEVLYAHCDGGFVLTREEQWKEAKVVRVYTSYKLLNINNKRGVISNSWYTFHIGDHKTFEQKMEDYLDPYTHLKQRLVFIVDGAKWIHNWISIKYPTSLQILDFYNAYEKICLFSTKIIKDKSKRKKCQSEIHDVLLKEGGKQALEIIRKVECSSKAKVLEQDKLLNYLERKESRMDYPLYIKKGLQIGSGAMKAAHRTLVQKRCKLSGQRWTINGATNIINLRNLNMNNRWTMIQEYLNKAA